MCVIDAHAFATVAAKTMNSDEGITGNRLAFNPLKAGEGDEEWGREGGGGTDVAHFANLHGALTRNSPRSKPIC